MYTTEELYNALRKADAAGDIESARKLTQYIQSLQKTTEKAEEPTLEKPVGTLEELRGGAKRFLSSAQTGLAGIGDAQQAAEQGLARKEGITERTGVDMSKVAAAYNDPEGGLFAAGKELVGQVPNAIAQQLPNLGATIAGGRAGALAGAALPLPPQGKAIAGVVGGLAGAVAPSYFTQAGTNLERQAEEGKDVSGGKAYATAVPQAALDIVGDKLVLGKLFNKVLGIPTGQLGSAAAEQLAKEGLLKTLGKGTLRGIAAEVPTEVTQQMLERLQAGLPLTSPEAVEEYKNIAYQTALTGPLGVIGRVSDKSAAASQLEQAETERNKALVASTKERERQAQIAAQALTEAEQANIDQADIAGVEQVRGELARQEGETKQELVDALSQVRDLQAQPADVATDIEQPSTQELEQPAFRTKEDVSDVLKDPSKYIDVSQYDKADIEQLKRDLRTLRNNLPTADELARQQRQTELEEVFTQPTAPISDVLLDNYKLKNKKLRESLLNLGDLNSTKNINTAIELLNDYADRRTTSTNQISAVESFLGYLNDRLNTVRAEEIPNGQKAKRTRKKPAVAVEPTPVESSLGEPVLQQPTEVQTPEEVIPAGMASAGPATDVDNAGTAPSAAPQPNTLDESPADAFNNMAAEITFDQLSRENQQVIADAYKDGVLTGQFVDQIEQDTKRQGRTAAINKKMAERKIESDLADGPNEADLLAQNERPELFESKAKRTKREASTPQDIIDEFSRLVSPTQLRAKPPTIVNEVSELPDGLREQAEQSNAKAFVDPNTQQEYYIANRIGKKEIRGTILHEKGVHLGLKNLIGKDRVNFLANRIYTWGVANNNKLETRIAQEAIARADKSKEKIGSDRHNEEVIAYFTEIAVNQYGLDPTKQAPKGAEKVVGWLRELWNGITATLKKMKYDPNSITKEDIIQLVYGAARVEPMTQPVTETAAETVIEDEVQESAIDPVAQADARADLQALSGLYTQNLATPSLSATQTINNVVQSAINQPGSITTNLAKWLDGKVQALRVAASDRTASVSDQVREYYNGAFTDMNNLVRSDILAGQVEQVGNIINQQFEDGGIRLTPQGTFEVYQKNESVTGMFKAAKQLADRIGLNESRELITKAFYGWRAASLMQLPKDEQPINWQKDPKTIPSPADVALAVDLFNKHPELVEIRKNFTEAKNESVRLAGQTGFLSPAQVQQYLADDSYAPWFRNKEFEEKELNLGNIGRTVNLAPLKALKGGTEEVNDMLENMTQVVAWLTRSAVSNYSATRSLNDLQTIGSARASYGVPANVAPTHVVMTYKNGKRLFWQVDNPLDLAAFQALPTTMGSITGILSKAANMLRSGVVLFPAFSPSQLIQDIPRAYINSGVKNPARLIPKILSAYLSGEAYRGTSPTAMNLKRKGIVPAVDSIISDPTRGLSGKFGLNAPKTGVAKITDLWGNSAAYKFLHKFSYSSDLAVRMAIYRQTMEETNDEELAVARAREFINFNRSGASAAIRGLKPVIPFLGAYAQGMDVLYKSMTGRGNSMQNRKAAFAAFTKAAINFTALSIAYTLMVSGDEDYEEQKGYITDRSFIIPGTKYRLPVPADVGFFFKVIPERLTDYILSQATDSPESSKRLREGLAEAAYNGLLPPMTQPLMATVIELNLNKSFFSDLPIVTPGMEQLETKEQFTANTSELAKVAGSIVDMAPVKIDHVLKAIGGTSAGALLGLLDYATNTGVAADQTPGLTPFTLKTVGGRSQEDFYKLRNMIDTAYNTTKLYEESNRDEDLDEYVDRPEITARLGMRDAVNKLDEYMSQARQERRAIEADDTLTPEEKREQINEVLKQTEELLRDSGIREMILLAEEGEE